MRDIPRLQLETGMLALAGRFINLGLESLAAKELHAVKKRIGNPSAQGLPSKSSKRPLKAPCAEKDTLASLLILDTDLDCFEAKSLAITYHTRVLQLIASSRRTRTVEAALPILQLDVPGSPAALILQQASEGSDHAKATKQLDALYQMLVRMCPSLSSSDDAAAQQTSIGPALAFRLQTLALEVRGESLRLSGRQNCSEKEILEPFSKCLSALTRRLPEPDFTRDTFEMCRKACLKLGLETDSPKDNMAVAFSISRNLALIAETCGLHVEACACSKIALAQCSMLDEKHARRVAACTRKLSSSLLGTTIQHEPTSLLPEMRIVNHALQQSLTGNTADYELLLSELTHAVAKLKNMQNEQLQTDSSQLVRSVARFSSRYAGLCPGKHTVSIENNILAALHCSRTNSDLVSWVKRDTASALVQAGALHVVSEKAASESLYQAWACSSSSVALSRVLNGLMLRGADPDCQKIADAIFDDEALTPSERGAVLEWQLDCALNLAQKRKFHRSVSQILLGLTGKLMELYTHEQYPIRRARVLALILRALQDFPDLLSSQPLRDSHGAQAIDTEHLGQDEGLKSYLPDIEACVAVARAFDRSRPTVEELKPSLLTWQRLLGKAGNLKELQRTVQCPSALALQLSVLEDYLAALGEDSLRLVACRLLYQCQSLCGMEGNRSYSGLLRSACAFSALGFAEKAKERLMEWHRLRDSASELECLEYHITHAEYLLSIDDIDACIPAMKEAAETRAALQSRSLRSHQSKTLRILHVRGWLVQSKCLLASGQPHEALRAVKKAVKLMNSIWAVTESFVSSTLQDSVPLRPESPRAALTRGISKLNLKPELDGSRREEAPENKGARFWPLLPLMCHALMHMSDLYRYHGIFNEANYASTRAVDVAEAVGSAQLLSRMRYHRGIFLALSGKVDEAELGLSHEQDDQKQLSPLTKVMQLRAKSGLCIKHGDWEDAARALENAEAILKQVQSSAYVSALEVLFDSDAVIDEGNAESAGVKPNSDVKTRQTRSQPKPAAKSSRAIPSRASKKAAPEPIPKENTGWGTCYILQKLEVQTMLERAVLCLKFGLPYTGGTGWLADLSNVFPDSFIRRQFEHASAMQSVAAALEADFSFSVLAESTLSYPALQYADRRLSTVLPSLPHVPKQPAKGKTPGKNGKLNGPSKASLEALLMAARATVVSGNGQSKALSTSEMHKLHCMQADASMTLSATSEAQANNVLHPVSEALTIDMGRIWATECHSIVARVERENFSTDDLLTWPEAMEVRQVHLPTAKEFEEEYIDILPARWTVVSLHLDDDCEELYIVRYRREQPPLTIRLPFSRQKSCEADEELFDFNAGKAELQEIIELSDYSCHSTGDCSAKGAKSKWWGERETLDQRLQELLINIENIWLGGFKGVFSQHERNQPQLVRLRKAFDAVLDRHLPSRQARGATKLSLDDQVLELFVGLGDDSDGEIDLDEQLADLLYFVVDMLQFNGERNAYDEIDFDNMAIEVLDALRSYHDAVEKQNDDSHLILVLDRRLQAFPWESLPFLENASVSRIDSMLSLRERLVEMRMHKQAGGDEDKYFTSRHSGAYILNPSGDLKGTETTLVPELAKLGGVDGAPWTAVVGREPSEDVFTAALQTASNLLYFGHGAGSQYIRPRSIRKLETCSEVVWLMGCSSGAVTEYDELEPFAVPLAYLQAGQHHSEQPGPRRCMAVVANLWDVTDKDIDRFSLAVGQEWGLWRAPEEQIKLPSKSTRKQVPANPATPEKGAKTPKTPKVRKTPGTARTPARSRSRVGNRSERKQSLVEAVAKSRDACYLRYLNGAAPVVYGIPVYLGD
jgi:separase